MTTADIARLRALLAAGTKGPWRSEEGAEHWLWLDDHIGIGSDHDNWDRDAALIAAAVNSLPELLDGYERAMAVVRAVAEKGQWSGGGVYDAWCPMCTAEKSDPQGHVYGCAWVASVAMSEGE